MTGTLQPRFKTKTTETKENESIVAKIENKQTNCKLEAYQEKQFQSLLASFETLVTMLRVMIRVAVTQTTIVLFAVMSKGTLESFR